MYTSLLRAFQFVQGSLAAAYGQYGLDRAPFRAWNVPTTVVMCKVYHFRETQATDDF